jgi:hypothetical protein
LVEYEDGKVVSGPDADERGQQRFESREEAGES